ncbi:hypothetical protein [Pseudomonas sp. HY7a-MNA-CIBAN-0227]|uniref:hypothetical protein n=1 Tax=Pseudomonas sp. HY7a-MNA-CIBAN-0227 TaxID=3140474 RepID=UPI003332DFDC
MSNEIDLNTFQDELNALLDRNMEALTERNDGVAVQSVKAFMESHYEAHKQVRLGSFFNEAIDTQAFTDDKSYIMFHRKDNDAVARVFVAGDGEIIGRFYETGKPSKEFTMGHEPDSDLYKVAVGVSQALGKDIAKNEHLYDVNDFAIATKEELGVNTFAEWLKPELEKYAVHFPSIKVDDVIKVLNDTDFYFHESMRILIAEGRFEKDNFQSQASLLDEIHKVGMSLNEISYSEKFERVEVAFNVDVEALSDYDRDDFEAELKAAFETPKKKPTLKM